MLRSLNFLWSDAVGLESKSPLLEASRENAGDSLVEYCNGYMAVILTLEDCSECSIYSSVRDSADGR